ncbi:hypothetical protein GZL_05520 [Streptomyces sp. 769]|nr:hypothetical protein GZL_05520 [Streptomyces sp. 769]
MSCGPAAVRTTRTIAPFRHCSCRCPLPAVACSAASSASASAPTSALPARDLRLHSPSPSLSVPSLTVFPARDLVRGAGR